MNILLRALLIGFIATTLTVACSQKTEEMPAENMTESAEPAVTNAEDAEDVSNGFGDAVSDAVDETANAAKDAADEVAKAHVEEAKDSAIDTIDEAKEAAKPAP